MNEAELLALLRADDESPAGAIPRRPESSQGPAPLSFAQQRLWFLQRYQPGAVAYNLTRAFRLHGALDADVLERAFGMLIARHEVLRTCFEEHDGVPQQVVLNIMTIQLAREDLSSLAGPDRDGALEQRLRAEGARPFDLAAAPLLRATLLRLGDDDHVLLIAMHHIISDAWSNPVLARDLSACYRAALAGATEPELPALRVQYADYALWQRERLRSGGFDAAIAQGEAALGPEPPPPLNLPTDRPRPAQQGFRGARVRRVLPAALAQALQVFCRTEGCTPYVVLLAAWQVLLGRYSGQNEFAIGVPQAARHHPELEELVGFFVNTQVVRVRLAPNLDTHTLCKRLRDESRDALDHADLPFELLLQRLPLARDASRSPLFQVLFNLQTLDRPVVLDLAGMRAEAVGIEGASAKFELTLDAAIVGGELRFDLEYNADLFEPRTAERIAGHYAVLLAGMLARPGERLQRLPLLDGGERHVMLYGWNRTARDLSAGDDLIARFERQVRSTPDRVAVVSGKLRLSYDALNRRANRLAHWLRARGVRSESLVAVCLDREPDLLVTLLSIQKAGGAYVPIDASQPVQRNRLILSHAMPHLALTRERLRPALQGMDHVVTLEALESALVEACDDDLQLPVHPQQLAYVLHTSGSSGLPKGVPIHREAFANFLAAMQAQVVLDAGDALLAVTTLSFDIAGLELFLPLVHGARVVLASREDAMQPQALLDLMQSHAIIAMQATPATWQMLVEHDSTAWHGLQVLCGGEALRADLAERLLARGVRLHNVYGPTETTVWSSAWPVPAADTSHEAVLAIGRPIANNRLHVLDAELEPVPPGVVGELYIGGIGLARGYLRRPGVSAAAFVPNPFTDDGAPGAAPGSRLYRTGDLARCRDDGVFEFVGRRDGQVKLRGFRVELGEIEVALASHPAVLQVVVEVRAAPGGEPVLVGYWVPRSAEAEPPRFEGWLSERLPAYMLPSRFVALACLPLNANGKIDRQALPAPQWTTAQQAEPPATDTERQLAAIWQGVLGVTAIGADDDIFLLGAQSLQLVRVQAQAQQKFGCELPLPALFGSPRLREMAALVDAACAARRDDDTLQTLNDLLVTFEQDA